MKAIPRASGAALLALAAAAPLLAGGCAALLPEFQVNVNVLDQATQLENQVRGSYENLSEDLVLIASVRGVDESGQMKPKPKVSKEKVRALSAMQSREFNQDDIDRFKKDGCAGEGRDGFLAVRECDKAAGDAKYHEYLRAIVEEENADRLVLMQRVIETNADLGEGDLDKVKKVFGKMNRGNAKPGEWVESDEGSWARKAG